MLTNLRRLWTLVFWSRIQQKEAARLGLLTEQCRGVHVLPVRDPLDVLPPL